MKFSETVLFIQKIYLTNKGGMVAMVVANMCLY